MKIKTNPILHVVALILCTTVYSCHTQEKGGLVCIDAAQAYPEKEIVLSDIADVAYLCVKSDNDEYLFKGRPVSFGKNTVVVLDNSSGSLLFFTKDGNPKSRFNHKGIGPEDYINVNQVVYDEEKDEIFVVYRNVIQIYSSTGKHKRKITLPAGVVVSPVISFDDESLFLYDASVQLPADAKNHTDAETSFASPFVRISKTDGKVLDCVELPTAGIELGIYRDMNGTRMLVRGLTHRVIKCDEGALLCNPETDTVFLYGKDGRLNPVMCKTPAVGASDPMVYLNNCVDAGRYRFMEVYTIRFEEDALPYPATFLMHDKETGELFRQKITLPDYMGKRFYISPRQSGRDYENGAFFELDLIELKQAYKENKLSGKLKELTASLDEDKDNNIFLLFKFK
ncbi:MAG: 6-bladed beta-propeller [Tannerella sp.]|jgi:hypothetical protein|nr:6-bladed beta-propeller [Tannerella sp.]